MFSGGATSWAAAKRVVEKHGSKDVTLFFANTKAEDEDLYRFLADGAANVGAPLVYAAEGRDPWQVMFDERMLGNSRFDPCSRILKRQVMDRWLAKNCDPKETIVYIGIDWTEEHRYIGLRDRRAVLGWKYEAPLCEPPWMDKDEALAWMKREGIRQPRLYDLGFSHNNCGGFCIKGGQGHFANLLRVMPERYAYHEQKEQDIRALLGKDVSIMTDRSGDKKKKPLTLKDLRIRIERGTQIDAFDIGGCGCFVDEAMNTAQGEQP
jgi:hypothetical protein